PYEILRSGQETADRRSFQIWPEQISNDEQPRHPSALLNDPERIAAVEQHSSHHGDVELSKSGRQIVNVPVVDLRFGLVSGVAEPIRILQPFHVLCPWAKQFFQFLSWIRDKIPAVLRCYFDRNDLGAAFFHLKSEKPARGTDL